MPCLDFDTNFKRAYIFDDFEALPKVFVNYFLFDPIQSLTKQIL